MKIFIKLILTILVLSSLVACNTVDKEKWQTQYDLGIKYLEEGNYEEAVIAFTKAIEIDAKSAPSYIGRADAYAGLAKETDVLEESKEYCEKALQDYEEAENLGSEDIDEKKQNIEKLLEEVIKKIEEAIEKEKELLKQQEEVKKLFEPLYACFAVDDIKGAIELMRQEEYIELNKNMKSEYLLYENGESEIKLVSYPQNYYYFGEFVEGERSGNGLWIRAVYEDGISDYDIYDGQWSDDLPNGTGQILRKNLDTIDEEDSNYYYKWEEKGFFTNGLYDGEINAIFYRYDGTIIEWETAIAVDGVYLEASNIPSEISHDRHDKYIISFAPSPYYNGYTYKVSSGEIHYVFGFYK